MKCFVKDCANHTHQGKFVDALCAPCFSFITAGEGVNSQAYRNTVLAEREACEKAAAISLLGADGALTQRVLKAIRARGEA